jgi:hypothetical protein
MKVGIISLVVLVSCPWCLALDYAQCPDTFILDCPIIGSGPMVMNKWPEGRGYEYQGSLGPGLGISKFQLVNMGSNDWVLKCPGDGHNNGFTWLECNVVWDGVHEMEFGSGTLLLWEDWWDEGAQGFSSLPVGSFSGTYVTARSFTSAPYDPSGVYVPLVVDPPAPPEQSAFETLPQLVNGAVMVMGVTAGVAAVGYCALMVLTRAIRFITSGGGFS